MAQIRPRPRTRQTTPTSVSVGGWAGTVHESAAGSWERAIAQSDSPQIVILRDTSSAVSISAAVADIGREGLRQAVQDAGQARSARTLYRWVREGRIPNSVIADLVQRRAFVSRNGGIDAVARAVGSSASSVSRYQSGRTQKMRGAAKFGMERLRRDDTLDRSGVVGPGVRAQVTVHALIEFRAGGHVSDEYTEERTITLPTLPEADSADLAAAIAHRDNAAAVAIIEQSISDYYGRLYDDGSGIHILEAYPPLRVVWG